MPLCGETKKKKIGRGKHNGLVPALVLISSSEFDNYTFRPPHEFPFAVHVRQEATESAVEGSGCWD